MTYKNDNILRKMLFGEELTRAFYRLPEYSQEIRLRDQMTRLRSLDDLYRIYIPSAMSTEIYHKLYQSMMRSLEKKTSKWAVGQKYRNMRSECSYGGTMGGIDSFSIIAKSGVGKTSAIMRSLDLITEETVIDTGEELIIPCLMVQTPHDASPKALLYEVLRKADELLSTNYYQNAVRARATTDLLIGSVSQVLLNHVGLLVCDEIQNVVDNHNGSSLMKLLTQLINSSAVSICMVGTPNCVPFFESDMQIARRTMGLRYEPMTYGEEFRRICNELWQYQYVQRTSEMADKMLAWLYEHTAGLISVLIALFHDAQEQAIMDGTEIVDEGVLKKAYDDRISMLEDYVEPQRRMKKTTSKKVMTSIDEALKKLPTMEENNENSFSFTDARMKSLKTGTDMISAVKLQIPFEEVCV